MLRALVIVAMFSLAVPSLAAAEEPHHPPGKGEKAGPHGPMGPHPREMHAGPMHPGPGGPGHQFSYHGHMFSPVHLSPFVYPHGWAYRRWAIGAVLPPLFLAPAYFFADWATLGLAQPQPGFQWVRYGPDLLLVNVTTGEVVETVYGAVY
jgi:Ni/Co efflux regulator RcnB